MKLITALLVGGAAVALYGCSPSTPGGPGTAIPESEKPMMGHTDNTFSLSVPMMAAKVEQGEEETVTIAIKRGTNFAQDVSLRFDGVPPGIHIQPDVPKIGRNDESVELRIHAAEKAAVGNFTVQVSGHPETGPDASAELSLTVSMRDMEPSAAVETEAARTEREAHITRMRAELDTLHAQYEDLRARASEAAGDAKVALDYRVAAAKVQLDEAEASLEEAKDAAPDRWERVKASFRDAADELKSIFG